MTLLPIEILHADPRNSNVCGSDVIKKLTTHMQETNFCPALLVRPHPALPEEYIVVDGHHRLLVAGNLGWAAIDCQIQQMDENMAGVLLLTLNRLRGTDVPRKRALLIESLLVLIPLEKLTELLPESSDEINGLLALIRQDEKLLEKAVKEQTEAELTQLPVPFGFMVQATDAEAVRKAISFYKSQGHGNQGSILVAICRDALIAAGVENGAF